MRTRHAAWPNVPNKDSGVVQCLSRGLAIQRLPLFSGSSSQSPDTPRSHSHRVSPGNLIEQNAQVVVLIENSGQIMQWRPAGLTPATATG